MEQQLQRKLQMATDSGDREHSPQLCIWPWPIVCATPPPSAKEREWWWAVSRHLILVLWKS